MSLVPGNELNARYLIRQTLDTSNLSRTYLAFDQHHQCEVVVKELLLRDLQDWKQHELFEREAEVLKNLQHPGIPRWLDYFGDDLGGKLFLITEKVPGQSLLAKLERGWRPTEPEILQLARHSLEILNYLHSLNPPVVHRDLKPSNLMLDDAGEVHLIDFGAVQDLLHPEGGKTVVGTFGYMAPEQFAGKAEPASDLYGLGMTLIHALSGRRPAELPQSGQRLRFREYVNCSSALSNWLEVMTAPQLAQRYKDAQAALQGLEDQLAGRETVSISSRPSVAAQPRWVVPAAVGGVVLLLGLGAGAWWLGVGGPPSAQASACFAQALAPPHPDSSTEAEAFRQDFSARFPTPEWWDQVEAPTFDDPSLFLSYWQCKERSPQQFFKSAYQTILAHPQNDNLVVLAINLMPYGDSTYPQLTELLEFASQQYFYHQDQRADVQGKTGDQIGGVIEKLAQQYNKNNQYSKSISLLERFLHERAQEVNDHIGQQLSYELAYALWKSAQPEKALQRLDKGLALPEGSWQKKLSELKAKIQATAH